MTGSAFITHNNTWSCSNDCAYSVTSVPIFDGEALPKSFVRGFQLVTIKPFHAVAPYNKGDKCEIVFKHEVDGVIYGWSGEIEKISSENTVIKIFTTIKDISKILSNITFKN